jgi:hypothetical protein
VLVYKYPARLIDEGRISIAVFRGLHKDGVVFDPYDPCPGYELGRLAPSVLDIDSNGLRIRFGERKHEIG